MTKYLSPEEGVDTHKGDESRPQQIHEAMLKTHYGDKLTGHVSRDATAMHAREKAEAKPMAQMTAGNCLRRLPATGVHQRSYLMGTRSGFSNRAARRINSRSSIACPSHKACRRTVPATGAVRR